MRVVDVVVDDEVQLLFDQAVVPGKAQSILSKMDIKF